MSTNNENTNLDGGASVSTAGLGNAVTGRVMFDLRSEPNKMTALDFGSLFIGDGCMVITFGGRSITHDLRGGGAS